MLIEEIACRAKFGTRLVLQDFETGFNIWRGVLRRDEPVPAHFQRWDVIGIEVTDGALVLDVAPQLIQ